MKQLFMQFLQVEHLQQSSRMSFSSAMHRPSTMTRAMVEKMMAQSPQPGGRGLHGQPSHRDRAPSILQPSGESCWFVRFKFGTRDYENFAQEVFFWKACTFFGVDPPAPPPPPQKTLLVPPPRQKGYQSAPFSNRHPSAYSSRPETEVLQSYGAKTEIRMPMHT